jgi:hypothetical protein
MYTTGAQSAGVINNPTNLAKWVYDSDPGVMVETMDANSKRSNTEFPSFKFQTLPDSLMNAGMTWRYYTLAYGTLGYQWSALDAINHTRNTPLRTQFLGPESQLLTDAAGGNPPAVSWLVPREANTNICGGSQPQLPARRFKSEIDARNSCVVALTSNSTSWVPSDSAQPGDHRHAAGVEIAGASGGGWPTRVFLVSALRPGCHVQFW